MKPTFLIKNIFNFKIEVEQGSRAHQWIQYLANYPTKKYIITNNTIMNKPSPFKLISHIYFQISKSHVL